MAQFTKKAIADSFIKLLNEKPLDKISVKDIVEDCGVNRNTFYYHYQDIYALLEDIFEAEARAVIEENIPYNTWQEAFITSTKFALQNKKAIYHIYNSINRDNLERYLYNVADTLTTGYVKRQAEGLDASEESIRLITLFYKHAVVGVILEWLQRGMKDEPENIIRKMGGLFDGNIRRLLEKSCGLVD